MLCFAFRFECLDFRAPFLKTATGFRRGREGERERERVRVQASERELLPHGSSLFYFIAEPCELRDRFQ